MTDNLVLPRSSNRSAPGVSRSHLLKPLKLYSPNTTRPCFEISVPLQLTLYCQSTSLASLENSQIRTPVNQQAQSPHLSVPEGGIPPPCFLVLGLLFPTTRTVGLKVSIVNLRQFFFLSLTLPLSLNIYPNRFQISCKSPSNFTVSCYISSKSTSPTPLPPWSCRTWMLTDTAWSF